MVLFPSALRAAISKATPARISGLLMVMPRNFCSLARPITAARCGSHKNDLCAHIDQFIYKEQAAFEHFLVDQYAAPGLGGYNQHNTQQVRRKAWPGMIIDGQYGAIEKSLYFIEILCRNMNIISDEIPFVCPAV